MRILVSILFSLLLIGTACKKEVEIPPANIPPVVNAGNNATVTLNSFTETITLNGSAADSDGEITGYMWSEIAGPNQANIATAGSATTTVSGLITGTYQFQLMATDNDGAVGVKAVTVTVTQNGVIPSTNQLPVVNAGNDTTFNFTGTTNDTVQLKGSATDPDGTITSYVWSQISGPNAATIINNGSAQTGVAKTISGTYKFQLVVTDNKGATASKIVTITVIKPTSGTLTLQPHQNPMDVQLAVLGSTNITDNTAPEFSGGAWTNGGTPTFIRGIFQFDLSSLPVGATVTSANLMLYSNPTPLNGDLVNANSGPDNSIFIQRATAAWTSSVTWQNQPAGDVASQVGVPHTTQSFLDINVDVTNLVKDMIQYGNNGFILKLQNETAYNSRIFCSSRHSNSSKHPKLVINYVP